MSRARCGQLHSRRCAWRWSFLLRATGYPQRMLLEELFGRRLTRRFERAMRTRAMNPALLETLMAAIPEGNAFADSIRVAASGDVEAAMAVEVVGVWESMLAALTEPLNYGRLYRGAIERASRLPLATLMADEFRACAQQLLAGAVASE